MSAAVMSIKLQKLTDWNNNRGRLAEIYLNELSGIPGLQLPVTQPGNNNTYHQFTVQSDRRNELQSYLKEREVDSMIYYPVPIHFHEPYAKYAGGRGSLPVTELVSEQVLSLPIHPHLSEDQVRFVCENVKEFSKVALG